MGSKGRFQTTRFVFIALTFCCIATFSTLNMTRSSTVVRAASCPSTCGSYNVPGLGARKQQILNTGGNSLDLAIAMMETETMQANYTYGDGKSGDAANFGIFKQNWYMLRTSVSQYQSYGSGSYNAGAALNSNLSWDIQCLHTSQNHYGLYKWFGVNATVRPASTIQAQRTSIITGMASIGSKVRSQTATCPIMYASG